ncbi:hypothetical protein ACHAXM_008713 [Skeletonema potamos]
MNLCRNCHGSAALLLLAVGTVSALSALSAVTSSNKNVVILGGSGRIGTAIATHLIRRWSALPPSTGKIILVGRNVQQGLQSVQEVLDAASEFSSECNTCEIEFQSISDVWDAKQLSPLFRDAVAVIHTAGPYHKRYPIPLRTAIESHVPVYVDLSDPLSYLDSSLELNDDAKSSGTRALVAAGAFPGLSNLLAMEAAGSLPYGCEIIDIGFNYFTAGLGGSGDVNLYITNLGFGDDMPQYEKGTLNYFKALTGKLLGKVEFFTDAESIMAKRVGSQQVFSWPFPEAATVARELQIKGRSHAAMGTSPDAWNAMLGLLVDIVPRSIWRNEQFSQFMADFSQPLVKFTDRWLRLTSPDGVGETHAMRIDVTAENNNRDVFVSTIVQGHESFRQCVGQSCAEFCIDLLQEQSKERSGGVSLVEQRYRDKYTRKQMIEKMTSTPGTIDYSGPVVTRKSADFTVGPSKMDEVLRTLET